MWSLVWELRCSTEGQKLGAASKIDLGVGAKCLLSVSVVCSGWHRELERGRSAAWWEKPPPGQHSPW